MIASISGELVEKWSNCCIARTDGGVGYLLFLPAHTFNLLPDIGARVSFYTFMAVRENAIDLYGFETFAERQTFEVLRGISKIGGRTALAILSALRPDELAELVSREDLAALTRIPGIGQKTAQHILLELRSKLPAQARTIAQPVQIGLYGDVMAAMANLGYEAAECSALVRKIVEDEPDLDLGSAIRLALKELAKS